MEIEKEIKQTKFQNEFHKVFINVIFTSGWLSEQFHKALKPYGVSLQQFNILRILRGQSGKPASIRVLQERMLDKMSNASRLVEKLRKKNLVERHECESDRRQVDVMITEKGMKLLGEIDRQMDDFQNNFSNLTKEEAEKLSNLLDKMRG